MMLMMSSEDITERSVVDRRSEELRFMAEYSWETLLALYRRFAELRKGIVLSNVDEYIELSGDVSDLFKAGALVRELVDVVKRILVRMQRVSIDVVKIESYVVRGRVLVQLAAKLFPSYVPVRVTEYRIETPANLLLVLTVLETLEAFKSSLRRLYSVNATEVMKVFRDIVARELRGAISLCEYLLGDPLIRPLVLKASLILGNERKIRDLERVVELECVRRRRELYVYEELLKYRRLLKDKVRIVKKLAEQLHKTFLIKVSPEKLYEIYGFTLVLGSLIEYFRIDDRWNIDVDEEGKVIVFESPLRAEKIKIAISYNAIPSSVKSRFVAAKAHGLIEDGIPEVKNIQGLPDTIIKVEKSGERRLVIIDYKYSRDPSYLVASRYKVYGYLHEFDADVSALVAPGFAYDKVSEDEAYRQTGFYQTAQEKGGAVIHVDSGGKILALIFAPPIRDVVDDVKKAMLVFLRIALPL